MIQRIIGDLVAGIGFLTRLPVFKVYAFQVFPPLNQTLWCYPLIGLMVGLMVGGGMHLLALVQGFPPEGIAVLGAIGSVLLTGCFHEDGLADTADGLGGGQTPERRLEIMRDSRLGTYGAAALFLGLLLKIVLWAFFIKKGMILPVVAVTEAISRSAMILPARLCPPAQRSGIGVAAHNPSWGIVGVNLGLSLLILLIGTGDIKVGLLLVVGMAISSAFLSWRAMCLIGGVSGDIYGALQQVSLLAILGMWCIGVCLGL